MYGVPYKAIEVDPLQKTEIKWSDYKKVPIVMVDGKQYNDSSHIITELSETFATPKTMAPRGRGMFGAGAKFFESEATWREWVDKWLVHVITINIYRSLGESYQAFDYISKSGNFPFHTREMARHFGAIFMYSISKNIKKKHSIEGAPRDELYSCGEVSWRRCSKLEPTPIRFVLFFS